MTDIRIVDARGLSCPQPVMLARKVLKQQLQGTVTILVDSGTARENVIRLAVSSGWAVKEESDADGSFKLLLTK